MSTLSVVVTVVASIALLVALASWRLRGYRRGSARPTAVMRELDALRVEEKELTDHLRNGFEDLAARAGRARRALHRLRAKAPVDEQQRIDALAADLSENQRAATEGLARVNALEHEPLAPLNREASFEARTTQQALAARQRRAEGRVQVLQTRVAIGEAEACADAGETTRAEALIREASCALRDAREGLRAELDEDPDSHALVDALEEDIASVHVDDADHRTPIHRAIAASDALFAALEAREEKYT